MHIRKRAHHLLNLRTYEEANQNVPGWVMRKEDLKLPVDQYVLRMMIKSPESQGIQLPPELRWLRPAINKAVLTQTMLGVDHPYMYITVRSGIVRSETDDEWHVDGFSMRIPHLPEQNYIWCDRYGTEHLEQKFFIPMDFDPLLHNLHWFFQDHADELKTRTLSTEVLHLIDPYIVHRRPKVPQGTRRTFFRISFVPIAIESDDNTPNPLLPAPHYGREDIRKQLTRY